MIACDMDAAQSLLLGSEPKGKVTVYRQVRGKFLIPTEKLA